MRCINCRMGVSETNGILWHNEGPNKGLVACDLKPAGKHTAKVDPG